jgi:hypothetical protein
MAVSFKAAPITAAPIKPAYSFREWDQQLFPALSTYPKRFWVKAESDSLGRKFSFIEREKDDDPYDFEPFGALNSYTETKIASLKPEKGNEDEKELESAYRVLCIAQEVFERQVGGVATDPASTIKRALQINISTISAKIDDLDRKK